MCTTNVCATRVRDWWVPQMCPKFGALAPPLPHVPCHASFWTLKKANQRCYKRTQTTALCWKVWMMSWKLASWLVLIVNSLSGFSSHIDRMLWQMLQCYGDNSTQIGIQSETFCRARKEALASRANFCFVKSTKILILLSLYYYHIIAANHLHLQICCNN